MESLLQTMKRWILTIEEFNTKPLIYAETAEKARQVFSSENVTDIQPYTDMSYLDTIQELKSKSELLVIHKIPQNRTREWYKYQLQDGMLRFRLYKDNADDLYYDIVEYQFMSNDSLVYPITFTYSNPAEVYELFFTAPLFCEVVSYRFYGQPKLSKPAELKGIKQSFSADWILNKCKCQCVVKGGDLWIKHRDFFSPLHRPSDPSDNGTPLVYRAKKYFGIDLSNKEKFCYSDYWGEIILRNEAWIVFRNLGQVIRRDRQPPIQNMIKAFSNSDFCIKHSISQYDLSNGDWERFFENVCCNYKKYVKQGDT